MALAVRRLAPQAAVTMNGALRTGTGLARGTLLLLPRFASPLLSWVGGTAKPAAGPPGVSWPLRRALSSSPPPSTGRDPTPVELLWDYYERNKPTVAAAQFNVPDNVYEREKQLAIVADDYVTAYSAYKSSSPERRNYPVPVCWGSSGSGKTTFGRLVMCDVAKHVKDVELKLLLEQRCQRIFLDFNGGGDSWTDNERHSIHMRIGLEMNLDLVYDIGLGVRLLARGILQQPTQDVLTVLPPDVLKSATTANVLRLAGQALRGSRESTEDTAVLIHMDEYQMIQPDEARITMMTALAGYRTRSYVDHVFVPVVFTGTSLQAAGRVFDPDVHSGITQFYPHYFFLPPLSTDASTKVVAPIMKDWPENLRRAPEVRSVIEDLGGLPRLLTAVEVTKPKEWPARMASIARIRPFARAARDFALFIRESVEPETKFVVSAFEAAIRADRQALEALFYIVISGLRVTMNTMVCDKYMIRDFDRGGVFSIVGAGDANDPAPTDVRLSIPQLRLTKVSELLGGEGKIPWLPKYGDLFQFPSFEMSPDRMEDAVAAVLAARLNALRCTGRTVVTVGDLFPGCTMADPLRRRRVSIPDSVVPCEESGLGDDRSGDSATQRRLLEDFVEVEMDDEGQKTIALSQATGLVMRRHRMAKCADVHFVLERPGSKRPAHFAIQCKTGVTRNENAVDMYDDAMVYMSKVAGMDHYFVLVSLHSKITRHRMEDWPPGLIVVDSMAEFAPLVRPLIQAKTRRRRVRSSSSE